MVLQRIARDGRFFGKCKESGKSRKKRKNKIISTLKKTKMTKEIAKFNADYFNIASEFSIKDKHINYLSGVSIVPHESGKGVVISASDRISAIMIYDENGYAEKPLNIKLNKENIAICKCKKFEKKVISVFDDESVIISEGDIKIGIQNNVSIGSYFPSIKEILREDYKIPRVGIIDGENLGKITKAGKNISKDNKCKIMFSMKNCEPIVIMFTSCTNALAVTMPYVIKNLEYEIPEFMNMKDFGKN